MVVGSCNVDLVARVPRLPRAGETLIGEAFAQVFGGKGANQAVAARRLGGDAHLVARVGEDAYGDAYLEALAREGVGVERVRRATVSTGIALIAVDAAGHNSIVVVPGANARLSPEDVDDARPLFERAAVAVAQLEVPQPTARRALELARACGAVTILNPAPAGPLDPGLLAATDFLVPNETELETLCGRALAAPEAIEAAARTLLARFGGEVVATLGERGALHVTRAGATLVPAHAVRAIDTTGAGDAFVGAFAQGLAAGLDPASAVRRANAVAAVSVTRPGAQPSLPSADDPVLASLLAGT